MAKGRFPENWAYFDYAHVNCALFINKKPVAKALVANPLESNISKFKNNDGNGPMAYTVGHRPVTVVVRQNAKREVNKVTKKQ